jgi:hypothetical protein
VFSGLYPTNTLVVPTGYTSGNFIQGTTTLSGSSFTSLGMSAGTYNYSWGAGAGQSFVLTIGGAGITPTPTATSVTPTPTPTSGYTSPGWFFYAPEGPLVNPPPTSDGQAIFTDNLPAGGTNVTYDPNKSEGVNFLNFNLLNSSGVDYTTQFTNLQTNGGTVSISQGSNTATYVLTPGMALIQNPEGFVAINAATATQTVIASSPFIFGTPITIIFS